MTVTLLPGAAARELERVGHPIVSVRGVSRHFPPTTVALEDVSFDVGAGESVSISGTSGSGKSTLLAILGLLDVASSGLYLLDGEDVTTANATRRTLLRSSRLGFVFQSFHLVQHLTARENVAYGLEARGVAPTELRRIADDYLERVGLGHRLDAFPSTMSGGEQQRVAIARAVAGQPRLLLCDEPTGNLDSRSSAAILDALFANLEATGCLIIVTHDVTIARRCHRHFVISDGRLREAETV